MNRLERYVARTIARNFVVALVLLLAIFTVINFMEELEKIGTGSYTLRRATWFILMTLPTQAYDLSPAAALLGSVNALAVMAARNELMAIWAAGVSRAGLIWTVLKAAALIVSVSFGLHELLAAPMAQRAEAGRSVALSEGPALQTANGFWTRDRQRFVNIRRKLPGGRLRGVYVYEFDDRYRMREFLYARAAYYSNRQWHARGVIRGVITPDGVETTKLRRIVWDRFLSSRQLDILFLAPENLSLPDLFRSVRSLSSRGESSLRYQAVLWKRLTLPVVTAVMIFLSIPFVLVGGPRAGSVGVRTVAGALTGIGFQMFNQMFARLGLVYALPPLLTALLPAGLALTFGLWLLTRSEA